MVSFFNAFESAGELSLADWVVFYGVNKFNLRAEASKIDVRYPLPPIFKSCVCHTEIRIPLSRKNISKPKKLWAIKESCIWLFSLTCILQKSCAYPWLLPVTWEWCKCIFTLIICRTYPNRFSGESISKSANLPPTVGKFINLWWTNAYICNVNFGILILALCFTSTEAIASFNSSKFSQSHKSCSRKWIGLHLQNNSQRLENDSPCCIECCWQKGCNL